jgi:hypothetical protein
MQPGALQAMRMLPLGSAEAGKANSLQEYTVLVRSGKVDAVTPEDAGTAMVPEGGCDGLGAEGIGCAADADGNAELPLARVRVCGGAAALSCE